MGDLISNDIDQYLSLKKKKYQMVASLKDISIIPKKVIEVPGGNVLRGIKSSEENFHGFEELYFSFVKKNYVKAWKKHLKMHMNLFVPIGKIRFVFAEYAASDFTFLEVDLSDKNHSVLSVPPGIWFGFMVSQIMTL